MSSLDEWRRWCRDPNSFIRERYTFFSNSFHFDVIPTINEKAAVGYRYESMRTLMIKELGLVNTKNNQFLYTPDENFDFDLGVRQLKNLNLFKTFVTLHGFRAKFVQVDPLEL